MAKVKWEFIASLVLIVTTQVFNYFDKRSFTKKTLERIERIEKYDYNVDTILYRDSVNKSIHAARIKELDSVINVYNNSIDSIKQLYKNDEKDLQTIIDRYNSNYPYLIDPRARN